MSVICNKRHTSDLILITKMENLIMWSSRILTSEKNIRKRYRWCCSGRVLDIEYEILNLLISANEIKVDGDEEKLRQRISLQETTYIRTKCLLSEMNILHDLFYLKESTISYWVKSVLEIQKMIKGWQRSDVTNYKKLATA